MANNETRDWWRIDYIITLISVVQQIEKGIVLWITIL